MTNQMPAFKLFSLVMLLMSTVLFFDSCTSVDCGDCINGECVEDANGNTSCECDPGYSGADCSILDACYNVECPTNSTCDEGTCYCDLGFMGDSCQTEIRSQFVGFNYTGEDVCPSGTFTYNASASNSSNGVEYFVIEGFGGFDAPTSNVTIKILDDTQFTIEEQTDAGDRVIVAGDAFGDNNIGTWDAATSTLSITYKIGFSDGTTEVCDMTLVQQ